MPTEKSTIHLNFYLKHRKNCECCPVSLFTAGPAVQGDAAEIGRIERARTIRPLVGSLDFQISRLRI